MLMEEAKRENEKVMSKRPSDESKSQNDTKMGFLRLY